MAKNIVNLKPMSFFREFAACFTLMLLCGSYYILLILFPALIYFSITTTSYTSYSCILALTYLIYKTFCKLDHTPQVSFWRTHWIWDLWNEYFDFTFDCSSCNKLLTNQKQIDNPSKKYIFFEFPHGVFPMGQLISVSRIHEMFDSNIIITGTGADIIFQVPFMRQFMAALGTLPARKESFKKMISKGYHCAVIPGGIAEMFLSSEEEEIIYLKKRRGTVKIAIQNQTDIIPAYFYGNTTLFDFPGSTGTSKSKNNNNSKNNDGILSIISRKLRLSIMFFYGRFFLPIPYRKPIHMTTAEVISVQLKDLKSYKGSNATTTNNDNDNNSSSSNVIDVTEEMIDEVMEKVEGSLVDMYNSKKRPEWESRPLKII